MTDRIDVIVVNYGTADLAIRAVQSVLDRASDPARTHVHLVDNASPGLDSARLREAHAACGWGTAVTLWIETENHGFGRGNNVVLEALARQEEPPDKVFLLNPDARLENKALDILAAALDADPQAAAAGAAVRHPDLSPVTAAFRFPGPVNEIARTVNLGLFTRLVQSRMTPLPPDHPAGQVDWVSGAAVMFRFEALRQAEFFDPGFFLYYEEVDLMRRLTRAGWRILYVPQARVIHEEGVATGKFMGQADRHRHASYFYQSWAYYFSRAFGRFGALAIAGLMLPAALVNILHRRLRGRAPTIALSFVSDHWRHVILPLVFRRDLG